MVDKLDNVVKVILWLVGGVVILYQSAQSCIWGIDCYAKTPDGLLPIVTWVFTSANGGLMLTWLLITLYVSRKIAHAWEAQRHEVGRHNQ